MTCSAWLRELTDRQEFTHIRFFSYTSKYIRSRWAFQLWKADTIQEWILYPPKQKTIGETWIKTCQNQSRSQIILRNSRVDRGWSKKSWRQGIPITRPGIYRYLRLRYPKGDFYEKFLAKIESADKLCNFVTRTLQYFDFCVRKSTVSQSISRNYRELAIAGALRTRNRFMEKDMQVVFAADETFLRFHEASSTVVAPRGAKRVGTAIKKRGVRSWFR